MKEILTISLPPKVKREIQTLAKREGKTASTVVAELLLRQLRISQFRAIRARLVPQARVQGIRTDEDVFKMIS